MYEYARCNESYSIVNKVTTCKSATTVYNSTAAITVVYMECEMLLAAPNKHTTHTVLPAADAVPLYFAFRTAHSFMFPSPRKIVRYPLALARVLHVLWNLSCRCAKAFLLLLGFETARKFLVLSPRIIALVRRDLPDRQISGVLCATYFVCFVVCRSRGVWCFSAVGG